MRAIYKYLLVQRQCKHVTIIYRHLLYVQLWLDSESQSCWTFSATLNTAQCNGSLSLYIRVLEMARVHAYLADNRDRALGSRFAPCH